MVYKEEEEKSTTHYTYRDKNSNYRDSSELQKISVCKAGNEKRRNKLILIKKNSFRKFIFNYR